MPDFDSAAILGRLADLRSLDAPTHGGRVLSYVYDTGLGSLDELAADAIRLMQPVNGLDPTTFGSVAALEREVLGFVRGLFHGGDDVVGTVTSGGTESCLLAVKTARDLWRQRHPDAGAPRLVLPATAHAAFHKAAYYFGLELDLVPAESDGAATEGAATDGTAAKGTAAEGSVPAARIIERLGDDTALVVVSAPNYPYGSVDPVEAVAAAAAERGIPCHVDACVGGFVLPFLEGMPLWDFRVAGVTSVSADLHKFGYAPKGASVLLQRGRDRHRAQYFATTGWPGYPVVNPSLLGSKSAGALAAAWAIIQALGSDGFAALTAQSIASTSALLHAIDGIEGLRVVGSPVGPLFAVATDESVEHERRVDPHHWADRVRELGFLLQQQPAFEQSDGTRLPRTTHLTITPVTASVLNELVVALATAADEMRGRPPVSVDEVRALLPASLLSPGAAAGLDSDAAAAILSRLFGALGSTEPGALPDRFAPVMALVEALPAPVGERLLTEVLARLAEPSD
ncbi:MAG: aspartate aminotransferase family protein [Cryobacterium sp.]|nr:aspartate aminotransferase family protein [Cryobacterium sp.]